MSKRGFKKRFKPGTHGCHEALHMASVLLEMVDERLVQHPAIERNKKWRKMAVKACDQLFDLYCEIGKAHL